MDWIQIHLALNHLPVIGLPLLILLLMVGAWRKNDEMTRLALASLALMAGVAIAIKFTGDFAAEQSVTRLALVKDIVTHHEEAGDQATTAVFVLGLSAALALFMARSGRLLRRWTIIVVISFGIIAGLLYARAAHTGGEISHPELRSPNRSFVEVRS